MTSFAALDVEVLKIFANFYVHAIWQHVLKHRNNSSGSSLNGGSVCSPIGVMSFIVFVIISALFICLHAWLASLLVRSFRARQTAVSVALLISGSQTQADGQIQEQLSRFSDRRLLRLEVR